MVASGGSGRPSVAGEWHAAGPVAVGCDAEHLVDGKAAVLKSQSGSGHVEPPYPGATLPSHGQHRVADVEQLAVWKHVAANERAWTQLGAADGRDSVVQQPPPGRQERREAREVRFDAGAAYVLGHADRGDCVESLSSELAVVLEAYLDEVGDPSRPKT